LINMLGNVQFMALSSSMVMPGMPIIYSALGDSMGWVNLNFGSPWEEPVREGASSDAGGTARLRRRQLLQTSGGDLVVDALALNPAYAQLFSVLCVLTAVFLIRSCLLCYYQSMVREEEPESDTAPKDALDVGARALALSNTATETGPAGAKCCGPCARAGIPGCTSMGRACTSCVNPVIAMFPELGILLNVLGSGAITERLMFPSLECIACIVVLPGFCDATGQLVASGDDVAVAVGVLLVVLTVGFVLSCAYVVLIRAHESLKFDSDTGEWSDNEGSNFLNRFHGLGIADYRPGMGHTFLWVTILTVAARSMVIGAYEFACPQGEEEACGYVQSSLVLIALTLSAGMLSYYRPFLDSDDQVVEEISAWCNWSTVLLILLLPTGGGNPEWAGAMSYGILAAQAISLANQIWYNIKPLFFMVADGMARCCLPAEDFYSVIERSDHPNLLFAIRYAASVWKQKALVGKGAREPSSPKGWPPRP